MIVLNCNFSQKNMDTRFFVVYSTAEANYKNWVLIKGIQLWSTSKIEKKIGAVIKKHNETRTKEVLAKTEGNIQPAKTFDISM